MPDLFRIQRNVLVGRCVSTYSVDVTMITLNNGDIDLVGRILMEHEAVTGAKINADKSVGFRLDT